MGHVLVGRPKILKNLVPSELLQQQKGKNLGIQFQELLLSAVVGGAISRAVVVAGFAGQLLQLEQCQPQLSCNHHPTNVGEGMELLFTSILSVDLILKTNVIRFSNILMLILVYFSDERFSDLTYLGCTFRVATSGLSPLDFKSASPTTSLSYTKKISA